MNASVYVYLFKGVDTIDLPAQPGVDRNNGKRSSISQSCRPRLGIVPPVEGQDDGGIVAILRDYFLFSGAEPGTDVSLLDISINSATTVAFPFISEDASVSALKVRSNNSQTGTLFTLILFVALESLDLIEILI